MEPSRINPQAASQRILEVQPFTTLPDRDPDQDAMNESFFRFPNQTRKSESVLILPKLDK